MTSVDHFFIFHPFKLFYHSLAVFTFHRHLADAHSTSVSWRSLNHLTLSLFAKSHIQNYTVEKVNTVILSRLVQKYHSCMATMFALAANGVEKHPSLTRSTLKIPSDAWLCTFSFLLATKDYKQSQIMQCYWKRVCMWLKLNKNGQF